MATFQKMMSAIKSAKQAQDSAEGAFKFKTFVKASTDRKDSRWHHMAPRSPIRGSSGGLSPTARKKVVLKIASAHALQRANTQPSIQAVTEEVEDPRLFFLTPAFCRQASHKSLFRPNTAPPSRAGRSTPTVHGSRPQSPVAAPPPAVVFESRREERAYMRRQGLTSLVPDPPPPAWFFRSGAPGPGQVYYKAGAGVEGGGGRRRALSVHEKGMETLRELPPAMRSRLGGIMSDQTVSVAARIDGVLKSKKLGEEMFSQFSRKVVGAGGGVSRAMVLEQWLECLSSLGALQKSGQGVVEKTLDGLGLTAEQGNRGLLSEGDAVYIFTGVCNGEGTRAEGLSPQVWAKRAWRARKRQQEAFEFEHRSSPVPKTAPRRVSFSAPRRVSFSGDESQGAAGAGDRRSLPDAPPAKQDQVASTTASLERQDSRKKSFSQSMATRGRRDSESARGIEGRARSMSLDSSSVETGGQGEGAPLVLAWAGAGRGRRRSLESSPISAAGGGWGERRRKSRSPGSTREGSKLGWVDWVESMKRVAKALRQSYQEMHVRYECRKVEHRTRRLPLSDLLELRGRGGGGVASPLAGIGKAGVGHKGGGLNSSGGEGGGGRARRASAASVAALQDYYRWEEPQEISEGGYLALIFSLRRVQQLSQPGKKNKTEMLMAARSMAFEACSEIANVFQNAGQAQFSQLNMLVGMRETAFSSLALSTKKPDGAVWTSADEAQERIVTPSWAYCIPKDHTKRPHAVPEGWYAVTHEYGDCLRMTGPHIDLFRCYQAASEMGVEKMSQASMRIAHVTNHGVVGQSKPMSQVYQALEHQRRNRPSDGWYVCRSKADALAWGLRLGIKSAKTDKIAVGQRLRAAKHNVKMVLQKEAEATAKEKEKALLTEGEGGSGKGRGAEGGKKKNVAMIEKSEELKQVESVLEAGLQEWQQACEMLENTEELLEKAIQEGRKESFEEAELEFLKGPMSLKVQAELYINSKAKQSVRDMLRIAKFDQGACVLAPRPPPKQPPTL